MRTRTCPKCNSTMAEGFVPDTDHSMANVPKWYEGAPQKGWWGNIKTDSRSFSIATWRCTRCGFLEHYASG